MSALITLQHGLNRQRRKFLDAIRTVAVDFVAVEDTEDAAMAFEVFDRKSVPRIKEPTITVQRRGTLSLSGQAVDLLLNGEARADEIPVELLYDSERKIIGVRKAPTKMNAHLLRRQGKSSIYLIAGSMFCNHYEIDTAVARRYRAKKHGDIVGICLTEPHIEVARERPKTGSKSEDKSQQQLSLGSTSSSEKLTAAVDADPWRS